MKPAIVLAVLLLSSVANADQWTFFYPEMVKTFACRVEVVNFVAHGTGAGTDKFTANAYAERDPSVGRWDMQIGVFPLGLKGRHQAEKACSKWMDEATKRVVKARAK